jgi:hypothetical protein
VVVFLWYVKNALQGEVDDVANRSFSSHDLNMFRIIEV